MNQNRTCDLCGLDIGAKPFYLQSEGRRLQFCCEGCLGIYQLLHDIPPAPPNDTPTSKGDKS